MLTLEMLFAVLQGLPATFLTQLDPAWQDFCSRLEFALHRHTDPLEALKHALLGASQREIRYLGKALAMAESVMSLPGLSARQKQVLIVLRYEHAASLSRLHKLLNWDRGNAYHSLSGLIKKGYVGKFYGDAGPSYFAIARPLDNTAKSLAFKLIQYSLRELMANNPPPWVSKRENHNDHNTHNKHNRHNTHNAASPKRRFGNLGLEAPAGVGQFRLEPGLHNVSTATLAVYAIRNT